MNKYFIFSKFKFVLLAILKILVSILFVGLALIPQLAIDMVSNNAEARQFIIFIIIAVIYVLILVFGIIAKEYLTAKYCNKCSTLLKNDYIKGVLNLRIFEYLTKETGAYFSVLTNDIGVISNKYFRNKLDMIDDIATFVIAVIYVVWIHYVIALGMLSTMFLVILLPFLIHKPFNQANTEYLKCLENYTSICKNFFSGMTVIKTCRAEKIKFSEIEKNHQVLYKKVNKINYFNVLANNLPMALVCILQLSSVLLSGYLALNRLITIGSVSAVLQLGNSIYSPMCQLVGRVSVINSTKEINKNVLNMTKETIDEKVNENIKLKNCIEIKDLTFGYDKNLPVIKNFSMTFSKGKKYLIEGESGSGKSTLLKLVAKILIPDSGEIYWDKQSYNSLDENLLYSKGIGYVGQDAFIFNDSIKNNIDVLREGDNEKLARVIKICNLTKWIEELENGLEHEINEDIVQVSGGQRTRISLARILYLQPQVLLLDEITSALDNETAFSIESYILELDCTAINISHKSAKELRIKYDKIIKI